jgi:YVTN family beta-propeller protein
MILLLKNIHFFSDTKYEILDPVSNEAVEYWSSDYPDYPAQGIAFRPDGGRIYSVTHSSSTFSGELEVHAGSGAWDKTGKSAGNFNALIGSLNLDSHMPKSIVPAPDGSKVYIPCSATNKVITVDVTTDSSLVIINETDVGNSPWGCTITPDGTSLYVTNKGSNNVSVINTSTNNVIDSIPVGIAPFGIAINPAGTLAYVANSGSNNISVIDLSSNKVISTIEVGTSPNWLIFTPDGIHVFVTNNGSSTVSMIDAGTHKVLNSIPVGLHPEGICVYPDGSKVYVATDSTANIINTSDLSVSSINNTTVYKSKKNIVAVANCTSRIAGRVRNGIQQPINNAVIRAFRDSIEIGIATTNASGDYSIFNLKKGSYDIKVAAPNYYSQSLAAQGVNAGEIKTCYFDLIPFLPEIPFLISPLNNSNRQSLDNTLVWTKSSLAYSYHLQISEDSLFQDLAYNDSTVTDTTKQVSNLSPAAKYYWRVEAKNESGFSNWSTVWNFSTIVEFPEIPILSSPENGATNQPLNLILQWNQVEGAITYSLQVSAISNFTNTIVNQVGLTETGYWSNEFVNGTKYYWKVKATNAGGTSDWSDIWNFTTKNTVEFNELNLNQHAEIYPNPTNNNLIIEFTQLSTGMAEFVLYSVDGRMLMKTKLLHLKNEIDISQLRRGIYMAEIKIGNSKYYKKLIKN